MKIAIVSDMHIGYERFSEDAIAQAREALETASSMADAIIMPGDIFDKRAPKPEVIAQAINLFREISQKQWKAKVSEFRGRGARNFTSIPVIGISGTHERTAFGKENPLSLLGLAGIIVDTSEATTIIEKDGEKVAVFGLGGISEERVKDALAELDPKPIPGMFNVFMFHQSTYELLPFSDEFIHNEDLPKGFDLYVNGHIHSRVEMSVHGKPFLIPGSTVLTQLKEGEQEGKGFIIYDTIRLSYEFIRIKSRKMVFKELRFDGAKPSDIKDMCESAISAEIAAWKDHPIIKLRLEGTMAAGFASADMSLHSLALKFGDSAIIDIDGSRLKNPDMETEIEALRDNRIGSAPVKELGLQLLGSRLKEYGFPESIDYSALFSILSGDQKKEKAISEASELISSQSQP